MKKFTKHIIIHTDITVKADNKKDAQKIFEGTQLLRDTKKAEFEYAYVDFEKEWIESIE